MGSALCSQNTTSCKYSLTVQHLSKRKQTGKCLILCGSTLFYQNSSELSGHGLQNIGSICFQSCGTDPYKTCNASCVQTAVDHSIKLALNIIRDTVVQQIFCGIRPDQAIPHTSMSNFHNSVASSPAVAVATDHCITGVTKKTSLFGDTLTQSIQHLSKSLSYSHLPIFFPEDHAFNTLTSRTDCSVALQ